MWKVWKAGENICVIWQQICARPACNPITFPFLKRTILKYGSLCESRVRWNFQGGFWGGAAWCIFVCMQFFPIPDSWGDSGVPDNQTEKIRRFISVKDNSTTYYRLTLSLSLNPCKTQILWRQLQSNANQPRRHQVIWIFALCTSSKY